MAEQKATWRVYENIAEQYAPSRWTFIGRSFPVAYAVTQSLNIGIYGCSPTFTGPDIDDIFVAWPPAAPLIQTVNINGSGPVDTNYWTGNKFIFSPVFSRWTYELFLFVWDQRVRGLFVAQRDFPGSPGGVICGFDWENGQIDGQGISFSSGTPFARFTGTKNDQCGPFFPALEWSLSPVLPPRRVHSPTPELAQPWQPSSVIFGTRVGP